MKREAGRILPWRSWCSRCSRPASNSARRLSFCLPACHPVCQFSRDREAERGERRWGARRCRGGTGEISGAQALPVKSDMTFWFCHLSPTAMSEPALRSACHPPLPPSASVSLWMPLFLFLSPTLAPTPSLFSFSFSSQSCGFMGEMWRCDFQEKLRYNRQISL